MANGEVILEQQILIGSSERRYAYSFDTGKEKISELFATAVPVIEGSSIEVEEEVYIESIITERKLINSDRTWNPAKDFMGSYRLTGTFDVFSRVQLGDSEGLITSEKLLLKKTTPYVVVPPGADADYVLGVGRVNACTFELKKEVVPFIQLGQPLFQDRYRPVNSNQVFQSSQNIEYYPVLEGLIRQAIGGIGLYYNFGSQPIQVIYRMRIGGQVVTTRPVAEQLIVCPSFSPPVIDEPGG